MRYLLASAVLLLSACGGSGDGGGITPPDKKKPDPYLTIRVRDLMDTTTAPGRAHWHVFSMLTGPYTALNGIGGQGTIGLNDLELSHAVRCVSIQADSVGQRLVSILALADTTTDALTPDAQFPPVAEQWYNGNHSLPSGWMALTFPAVDAWQSDQYLAGHGLTSADPIKWNFDWTGAGSVSFAERTDNDLECARA